MVAMDYTSAWTIIITVGTEAMEKATTSGKYAPNQAEKIREMAQTYELKSILKELDKLSPGSGKEPLPGKKKEPENTQMEFDF